MLVGIDRVNKKQGGGGAGTLAATLALGNDSGGSDLNMEDDDRLDFGDDDDAAIVWDTAQNVDTLVRGLASASLSEIVTSVDNIGKDHGRAAVASPTTFWFSAEDVDVSDNQWGAAYHDGGDFVITAGEQTGAGSGPTTIVNGIKLAPQVLTSGGTDDYAVEITRQLNDSGAAGGTDLFNLIKGNITATDVTGWDTVNLMDLQLGGTSAFTVRSDGDVSGFGGDLYSANAIGLYPSSVSSAAGSLTNTQVAFTQRANLAAGDFFTIGNAADLTDTDAVQAFAHVTGDIGQSGTAGYNVVAVDWVETSTGSGTHRGLYVNAPSGFTGDLVRLDVNGSEKFSVTETGATQLSSVGDAYLLYLAPAVANEWGIYATTDGRVSFIAQDDCTNTVANVKWSHAGGKGMAHSANVEPYFQLAPTIKQSGTAGYNVLDLTWTETSTGSGAARGLYMNAPSGFSGDLIKLDVNASEMFAVDEAGNVSIPGAGSIDFAGDSRLKRANGDFTISADGNNLILMDYSVQTHNTNHASSTHPTFFIHSHTSGYTSDKEWFSMSFVDGASAGSGTATFTQGASAGLAKAWHWDIPVAAGGAAAAALDYQFKIDGTLEAGLLAETDGSGSYREPVFKIPYYTADYDADWSGLTGSEPSPASLANGSMFQAYNSNGGGAHRLYVYSNDGWHYIDFDG